METLSGPAPETCNISPDNSKTQSSYEAMTLGSPDPWKRYRVLIAPCKLAAPIVQRQFPPEDSTFAGWVSGFVNLDGQPRPTCKQAGSNRGSCNTLATHVAQQRREAKAEADRILRELDGRPPEKMPRPPRPKELAFDQPTKKKRVVALPAEPEDVAVEWTRGDSRRLRNERIVKLATKKLRQVTDQRKAAALRRKLDSRNFFSPCLQSLTEK